MYYVTLPKEQQDELYYSTPLYNFSTILSDAMFIANKIDYLSILNEVKNLASNPLYIRSTRGRVYPLGTTHTILSLTWTKDEYAKELEETLYNSYKYAFYARGIRTSRAIHRMVSLMGEYSFYLKDSNEDNLINRILKKRIEIYPHIYMDEFLNTLDSDDLNRVEAHIKSLGYSGKETTLKLASFLIFKHNCLEDFKEELPVEYISYSDYYSTVIEDFIN